MQNNNLLYKQGMLLLHIVVFHLLLILYYIKQLQELQNNIQPFLDFLSYTTPILAVKIH